MNPTVLTTTLLALLSLSACDRPTVVTTPSAPVVVPGPAGPQGATGTPGMNGSKGDTGKSVDNSTVIVMPPASAPASAPAN